MISSLTDKGDSVDYNYWAQVARLTAREASALLNGVEPQRVPWEFLGNVIPPHPLIRTLLLIERAQAAGELDENPRPADVIDWAPRRSIEVPEAFAQAVSALPRLVSFRVENESLKKQVAELKEAERLNPKRRTSLLIIAVICFAKFGRRPGVRSDWARQLISFGALHDLRISDKTLHTVLDDANEAGITADSGQTFSA